MIVTDASVIATAVSDIGRDGARFRERLRGQAIAAPDLMRLQVLSVIRRRLVRGELDTDEAEIAVQGLSDLPAVVYPTAPLLERIWHLRPNLTPYDACYVALAEALDCPLLTADSRLSRSPGVSCIVEMI